MKLRAHLALAALALGGCATTKAEEKPPTEPTHQAVAAPIDQCRGSITDLLTDSTPLSESEINDRIAAIYRMAEKSKCTQQAVLGVPIIIPMTIEGCDYDLQLAQQKEGFIFTIWKKLDERLEDYAILSVDKGQIVLSIHEKEITDQATIAAFMGKFLADL